MQRARQGEHFTALFPGQSCADQRTTLLGRLHHQHPTAEPGHDAVATRKEAGPGRGTGGMLGKQQSPGITQTDMQPMVARGIDHIDATAEHRHAGATGIQGGLLGGGIDTQRHAADHAPAPCGELTGETGGIGQPLAGGATRPHHGQLGRRQTGEVTPGPQQRRRVGNLGEQAWPGGVPGVQQVVVVTGRRPGQGSVHPGLERAARGMVEP